MKLYHLLLASLLLMTLFTPVLLAEPCAAAVIPGNNITLARGGIIWDYDEKITDNEAILFRDLIDREVGNNDNFVNAWEILKMEILLKDKMKKAIEEEPDVKLNTTSDTVELRDIEFWVSNEALGATEKESTITNRARVTYNFKEEAGPGTDIWLMGTPNSSVTIILPQGLDAELTEGFDNKSLAFENNRTVLRGNFSPEKNITLWLSENESFKATLLDMEMSMETGKEKSVENESRTGENRTATAGDNEEVRQSSRFFKNILKEINLSMN